MQISGKSFPFIALWVLLCFGCWGQSLIHRNITTADGLPSNFINHFFQDSKGNMWIATDKGVCRYNGRSFMRLTVDDGLPKNMITCSNQDRKGNMWFGSFSDSGLSCWNGIQITNFDIKRKGVKQIFFDSRNRVYYSDLFSFHCLGTKLPLPTINKYLCNAFQISPDSILVFYPGCIYLLDASKEKIAVTSMPEPAGFTRGLMIRNRNRLYVLGNGSFCQIDLNGGWPLQIQAKEKQSFFSYDALATDTSILLAVSYGLLEHNLANRKTINLRQRYGLPSMVVNSLHRDRSGNLWIGTYGKGALVCSQRALMQTNDPGDRIVSIASNSGEVWAATSTQLFKYQNGLLHPKIRDRQFQISSLAHSSGSWWLTDYHFLYGPANTPTHLFTQKNLDVPVGISGFCKGPDSLEYTGTYGWGIIRTRNLRPVDTLLPANGLCDDMIEKVISLKSGVAALSYSKGFSLITPGQPIQNFNRNNGLISNTVYIVAPCGDSLLVGTEGGLNIMYKNKVVQTIGIGQGFEGSKILYCFTDSSRRHFAVSDKAIHMLEPHYLRALHSYNLLADPKHIVTTCFFDAASNSLLVGTNHGLLSLHMSSVTPDTTLYTISLEDVRAGKERLSLNKQAMLPAKNNNLSFSFLASYYLPEQAPIIRYKLTGYDTAWHMLHGGYRVNYANLPAGSYQFEASITNADGYSTPVNTMYTFTIKPFWWRTGWFTVLAILFALLLISLAAWGINRKRFQNKLALLQAKQAQQEQRERISRELHDNIGSQLAYIAGNLDWISQPESPLTDEQRTQKLIELGVSTREVIDDLRESIWTLKNDKITVALLAQRLQMLVQKLAPATGNPVLSFRQHISSPVVLDPSVALNLMRITQEALHNVLQHARASNVQVVISSNANSRVEITIADDGQGMTEADRHKPDHYGFENMERRAADSGLSLLVESEPGNGTSIRVATNP
jgi:signal transduction histidine kinase